MGRRARQPYREQGQLLLFSSESLAGANGKVLGKIEHQAPPMGAPTVTVPGGATELVNRRSLHRSG